MSTEDQLLTLIQQDAIHLLKPSDSFGAIRCYELYILSCVICFIIQPASCFSGRLSMVEGHGVARVAAAHRKLLQGLRFRATSPNGRFVEGAQAISGQVLSQIESIGKYLFYFFGEPATPRKVMNVHFGMSGSFRTGKWEPADKRLEATPTTRLMLVSEKDNIIAILSAMTVTLDTEDIWARKLLQLGPDPLREDADKERLWQKIQSTKKSIGLVLMDQSFIAGLGNIFRAEVLYKSRLHPEFPAALLSREQFEEVWRHSVDLLQRGFKSGSILTVDPEEAVILGKPWTRRYVYNHSTCGRCKGPITSWDMASRTVYACTSCQALPPDTQLLDSRSKAMKAAKVTQEFVSHCAEEDSEVLSISPGKMTVSMLKAELLKLAQPVSGKKAILVERLTALRTSPNGSKEVLTIEVKPKIEQVQGNETEENLPETPPIKVIAAEVKPGTKMLGEIASAHEAALEKAAAGENRAVEHVALHDELEGELLSKKVKRGRGRSPKVGAADKGVGEQSRGRKRQRKEEGREGNRSAAPRRSSRREWAAEVAVSKGHEDLDRALAEVVSG